MHQGEVEPSFTTGKDNFFISYFYKLELVSLRRGAGSEVAAVPAPVE